MKMFKKKIILSVISGLVLSSAVSAEKLRITALGGGSVPLVFMDPMPQLTVFVPDFGTTFGGQITADFIPMLKFDAGLLYKKTSYSSITASLPPAEFKTSYEHLFIPVTARIELLAFSFGLGAYYAMPLKDEVSYRSISPTTGSTTSTFAKSNLNGSNYGLMATLGFRYKLPLIPLGFLADVWFLQGLNELSTLSNVSRKQSDVQFLLGVSLYL
ncbi:MAG: outer membrane beta-barrel protein [Spirochaetia bacterium]|nr:outer membrane beta-barrel protein [Spirochaetia bacterium]